MKRHISEIAFTPAVKRAQEKRGSRKSYARMEERGRQGPWRDVITREFAEFISERDSLYLGTASADGRPHVQHRGGPKGFVKVLDDHTIAFADFAGNAQYISLGNLSENNKAFIFFINYPNQQRIKIWGTAEFIDNNPELMTKVVDHAYRSYEARPERILVFHVEAWSPNCNQHIKQRFTKEEAANSIVSLEKRIVELERINASLVKQLQRINAEFDGGELPVRVKRSSARRIVGG